MRFLTVQHQLQSRQHRLMGSEFSLTFIFPSSCRSAAAAERIFCTIGPTFYLTFHIDFSSLHCRETRERILRKAHCCSSSFTLRAHTSTIQSASEMEGKKKSLKKHIFLFIHVQLVVTMAEKSSECSRNSGGFLCKFNIYLNSNSNNTRWGLRGKFFGNMRNQ